LQGAEGQPVDLTDLIDLDDVGMLQTGYGLRLQTETGQLLFVSVAARQDHLQGNGTLQRQVPGLVDDPHAATAQHALDRVTGDGQRSRRALAERSVLRVAEGDGG